MREAIAGRFVGATVKRVEDPRLLTGTGRYVDDVSVPDMLHAAFVRSPHPHALIRGVDAQAARRVPGVVAVFTGADVAKLTNPFIGLLPLPGLYHPVHYALAIDRVRLVGDPVAIVIATSRYVAEDAAALVVVDYEELEPIATVEHALDDRRPPIWPGAQGNVLFEATDEYGDLDRAFRMADRVVSERFTQHRHANQPMETRGCIAEIDPTRKTLTYHAGTQSPHALKWSLGLLTGRQSGWRSLVDLWRQRERLGRVARTAAAYARQVRAAASSKPAPPPPPLMKPQPIARTAMLRPFVREPRRLSHLTRSFVGLLAKDPVTLARVVAQDIGGAFGAKTLVMPEDVAVVAAAIVTGRSIKWIEDRNEHLVVGAQARDEYMDVDAAFASDGTLLGLHARLTLDQGAYAGFPVGAAFFTRVMKVMMPGQYRVPAFRFDARVTASNKATYCAYRAPWAAETWVRERLLDVAARELGIGRDEIRLRNMVTPEELPIAMITGPTLDVRMSARATLEQALAHAEFDTWPQRQAAARDEGRILGLGFATYIEAAPGPPDFGAYLLPGAGSMAGAEPARLVLEEDGTVSVLTQQMPHGQSHETTLAQIAADEVGVPIDQVRVRYGDTAITPFGLMGTGGSRSAAMTGGAVTFGARALRDQILDVAADLLEAARDDLVITDGAVHVTGVPSISVSLADVARQVVRSGTDRFPGEALRAAAEWDGGEGGWAQATHVCWVEVDLDTGRVHIPRYVVVEDCGELINPHVVDGQIAGGIVQGIGAVLFEKTVYDDNAQIQTGTFMDYLIPTAAEVPEIEIHHIETPSSIEANYRGVGEGGMLAAPPAITNAIEDALAHLGVRITEQHLPPTRILELAGVIPAPTARP
jgi:aerobic carbon-monoxide dehydrogenase large subunit